MYGPGLIAIVIVGIAFFPFNQIIQSGAVVEATIANGGDLAKRLNRTEYIKKARDEMLRKANMTGPNPNDMYQTMAEVMVHQHKYRGSDVFIPLIGMLSWENVTRFNSNPLQTRVKHVAFLKTHKTGSATLASVLFRYCARHHLRIFQPHKGVSSNIFHINSKRSIKRRALIINNSNK
jgi:hypothetical protein